MGEHVLDAFVSKVHSAWKSVYALQFQTANNFFRYLKHICSLHSRKEYLGLLVGHTEPEKNSVGIFEYILASMLKVYIDVF